MKFVLLFSSGLIVITAVDHISTLQEALIPPAAAAAAPVAAAGPQAPHLITQDLQIPDGTVTLGSLEVHSQVQAQVHHLGEEVHGLLHHEVQMAVQAVVPTLVLGLALVQV